MKNFPPKLKEKIKLPDNSTNYTGIDKYNSAKNIIPHTKSENLTFRFFFRDLFQNLTSSTLAWNPKHLM